eukprot:4531579-Amphidinium_carterae.1
MGLIGPKKPQRGTKRGTKVRTQMDIQSRMLQNGVVEIARRHSSANFHEAGSYWTLAGASFEWNTKYTCW